MYFFCQCTTSPWSKSERRLTKTYCQLFKKNYNMLILFIFNFQLSVAHWNGKKLFKRALDCEYHNQPCNFQPGDCHDEDCLNPLACVNTVSGPKCLQYDHTDPIGE